MNAFIGREKELEGLKGLLKKRVSSLVVVKGRRRIGKTRLAEEFTRSFSKSYVFVGIPPEKGITALDQREEFVRQMEEQRVPLARSNDWGDLFTALAIHCQKGRVLVIFDEITWMGGLDPRFLPKLKTIWDLFFKKNPKLILLITGSNSAWIDTNLLSSTGFVGRISHQLHLKELSLSACNAFWGESTSQISAYEKFKILSVTGGIPRYLEEIQPNLSAEQNILNICYQPTGLLFNEFDRIFSDLFDRKNQVYKAIVQQVARGHTTLTAIANGIGRSKGGDFSKYLDELVESDFLTRQEGWNLHKGQEGRLGHYRVSDNYLRFYLKYVEPYKNRIRAGEVSKLPTGWKSIMGLQFENLIHHNRQLIFRHLDLQGDDVVWSGAYFQTANARRQGCQIDCLIQTEHRVLYLCEIKFSEREIPFSVVKEVQEKARRLKPPQGFSTRYVLIHVNGVAERIENDPSFSYILDFGALLE